MFAYQMARSIQDDRIRRIDARAARARQYDAARSFRAAQAGSHRSIRRSIGRSIVRFGEAIAAENGQPVASS